MSGAPELADEKEFKATFSLLPNVLNLLKKLSSVQADPQKQTQPQLIQATVEELKVQLQRCRQLLECCPYLDQTPEDQQTQLAQKRENLKQMCDLLMKYKELDLLAQSSSSSSIHR